MQISVVVPDEIIPALDRAAERECRTRSGQACFYVVEALRRLANGTDREPWPPPAFQVRGDNLPAARAQLAEWIAERDALAKREGRTGGDCLTPHEQARLGWLRGSVMLIKSHISVWDARS